MIPGIILGPLIQSSPSTPRSTNFSFESIIFISVLGKGRPIDLYACFTDFESSLQVVNAWNDIYV